MSRTFLPHHLICLSSFFIVGILHIYMAARFVKKDIELLCFNENFSFGNKIYHGAEVESEPLRLCLVALHPARGTPNHFVPLLDFCPKSLDGRCDAGLHCLLKNRTLRKFVCKHCLFNYHITCVTGQDGAEAIDSCGCSDITDGKER